MNRLGKLVKMVLSSGYIYRVYQYGFRGFYFA